VRAENLKKRGIARPGIKWVLEGENQEHEGQRRKKVSALEEREVWLRKKKLRFAQNGEGGQYQKNGGRKF